MNTCDDGSGELDHAEFARVLEAAEEEASPHEEEKASLASSLGFVTAPAARGLAPGAPQKSRGEGKSRRREAGAAGVAGGAGGWGARGEELLPLSQMSGQLLTRRVLSNVAASTDTVLSLLASLVQEYKSDANLANSSRRPLAR